MHAHTIHVPLRGLLTAKTWLNILMYLLNSRDMMSAMMLDRCTKGPCREKYEELYTVHVTVYMNPSKMLSILG